jgi:hypothetical protein
VVLLKLGSIGLMNNWWITNLLRSCRRQECLRLLSYYGLSICKEFAVTPNVMKLIYIYIYIFETPH